MAGSLRPGSRYAKFPARVILIFASISAIVFLASFGAGLITGALQLPPYGLMKSAYHALPFPVSLVGATATEPASLNTNASSLIRFDDVAEMERTRRELREYIWHDDSLPSIMPKVEYNAVPVSEGPKGAASIDRLTITLDHGLVSTAYHYHAENPSGMAVIYHEGHGMDFRNDEDEIAAVLASGADVVGINMLLEGSNSKPEVALERFGKISLQTHDQIQYLRTEETNPIRYFLDPTIAVVNYLESEGRREYDDIRMTGLSGGGWTTTVAAAVDTRIGRSYPTAGTLPFFLLSPDYAWGDYESMDPELYRIATHLELYVLGATPGRTQVQVLNRYDSCCYGGTSYTAYESAVAERAGELNGSFSVFLDETHKGHRISPAAIDRILEAR